MKRFSVFRNSFIVNGEYLEAPGMYRPPAGFHVCLLKDGEFRLDCTSGCGPAKWKHVVISRNLQLH